MPCYHLSKQKCLLNIHVPWTIDPFLCSPLWLTSSRGLSLLVISTSSSYFFSLNTLQSSFFFLHHSKNKTKTCFVRVAGVSGADLFCADQSWFMPVVLTFSLLRASSFTLKNILIWAKSVWSVDLLITFLCQIQWSIFIFSPVNKMHRATVSHARSTRAAFLHFRAPFFFLSFSFSNFSGGCVPALFAVLEPFLYPFSVFWWPHPVA